MIKSQRMLEGVIVARKSIYSSLSACQGQLQETFCACHRQILGRPEILEFLRKKICDFLKSSNQHNFANTELILEFLDVLESPDRVLFNFDSFVR